MPFLSARALKGLKQYKYKPAGYTILDDIHQPFWNGITNHLPMWLAPNLITLTGLAGLLIAYVVSAIYLPAFQGEAPWWVYFLSGFAVFAYLHLDCIDGKQARRTNTSSPLGQLFDHGCDALSVHLVLSTVAATLGVGAGWKGILSGMTVMGPWLLAHWEEYHTGVMNYGNGLWGVTEANYALVLAHWIAAAFGPWIWQARLSKLLGVEIPGDPSLTDALLVVEGVTATMLGLGQLYRGLTVSPSELPEEERGHKALGHANALSHLLQLVLLLALGTIMMAEPARTLAEYRAVLGIFGVVYALEASQLIMDHMAKEPFELSWWPLVARVVVILNNRLQLLDSSVVAWVVNAVVVAGYLNWTFNVVDEICNYLGINCLTIKPSQK